VTAPRTRTIAAVLLAMATALAACEQEERLLRYKPFFVGLDGAQTQEPAIVEPNQLLPNPAPSDDRIIIELPNGKVRLVSRSVRDLMTHLERTLDEDQFELFDQYLLSQKTREYLASEGKTPEDLFRVLQKSRRAIARTFARMPFGERTPTCLFEKAGPRMFVLRLTGQSARNVPYTRLWVAYEGGEFRFVWLS
jgi:hypothetical protein